MEWKEEKLYKGQFTIGKLPQSYTNVDPDNNGLPRYKYAVPKSAPFKHLFGFKITHVVHSTHMEKMTGICGECEIRRNIAQFLPCRKKPSKYCKTSYKLKLNDDRWIPQPPTYQNDDLLPGNYVWFSMKPDLPNDSKFNPNDYPVPYVNGITFYGPWSFTFEYTKLIRSYAKNIPEGAHVVLRNGGTLMYKREVCYVVIISHSDDQTHDDETYPVINEGEIADEVLELGQEYGDPLTFHPKCVPLSPNYYSENHGLWIGYDWKQLIHYDHVAFAVHCDWKGSFEIELPDGQPSCFFSDPRYKLHDEETYYKFHPLCLPLGTGKMPNGQYYPLCYDEELEQWEKTVNTPSTPHTLESSEEAAEALPEI